MARHPSVSPGFAFGLDRRALPEPSFERLRLATLGSCGSPLRAHAPCATRIAPRSSVQTEPGPRPLHAFRYRDHRLKADRAESTKSIAGPKGGSIAASRGEQEQAAVRPAIDGGRAKPEPKAGRNRIIWVEPNFAIGRVVPALELLTSRRRQRPWGRGRGFPGGYGGAGCPPGPGAPGRAAARRPWPPPGGCSRR